MKKTITSTAAYIGSLLALLLAMACTQKEPTEGILLQNLKKDVGFLASDKLEGRAFGTTGEEAAARYLVERFEELGLTPKGTAGFFQEFTVSKPTNPHEEAVIGTTEVGITGRNVLAYLDNQADKTVIIGAHFDHLGYGGIGSLHRGDSAVHNGADDNASGTAALLALAESLAREKQENNFLFIAFTGEENGLWGSNYFVKNPTIELSSVNYMINMDMVGRLTEEKTLAIYGTGTSPIFETSLDLANADSLKLVTSESGVGPSDHTSFYLQDLPVLHFFTGQHEDYHKPTDDTEKINFEGLALVIGYIDRLIRQLDPKPKLAFTKTKDSSGDSPRFTVTLGVVPDYLFDGKGMRIDGVSSDKPAEAAGLQKGDIILQLGDSTIVDMMSYMRALGGFSKGDQTQVRIDRAGTQLEKRIQF